MPQTAREKACSVDLLRARLRFTQIKFGELITNTEGID